MITNISIVDIWVKDIEASKAFYLDVIGFVEHTDITLGNGYRWCTVSHPSQPELQVHLCPPGAPFSPEMIAAMERSLDAGDSYALGLNVDDCRKTVEELEDKGVEVVMPPGDRPYGVEAVVRDNSGNWLVLVEPRDFSEADFEQ
jgi:predicted enzyme related to lactoylglutathione lyase